MVRRLLQFVFGCVFACASLAQVAQAQTAPAKGSHWVAAWTASAHGPYPVGNPTAQPELKFTFPDAARGAIDQSFRMIVRPDIWGKQARVRLSNAFGAQPVTFDGVFIGLQNSGAEVLAGTSRQVNFGGKSSVTVAPGNDVVSDAVSLAFVKNPADPMLVGRRLAVSFHVVGESEDVLILAFLLGLFRSGDVELAGSVGDMRDLCVVRLRSLRKYHARCEQPSHGKRGDKLQ